MCTSILGSSPSVTPASYGHTSFDLKEQTEGNQ